jgi:hypothetical protein
MNIEHCLRKMELPGMRNIFFDGLETPTEFYWACSIFIPPDESGGYAQNTPNGVRI